MLKGLKHILRITKTNYFYKVNNKKMIVNSIKIEKTHTLKTKYVLCELKR
jgi:hypothetical protein